MGVRGLTTFINSYSDIFFIPYKLHSCTLIVDGNSLVAVLYSETLGPNSAFGGDYDLLAYQVDNFIKNLKSCNIEAVFIFDGGYEKKKASTVKRRNEMKVWAIDKITPDRPARDFFPLMMRMVIQEKLLELGVTCLQSDLEADRDIATIAKQLNAPVLSNDSDFFIFDVLYIPLSTFSFNVSNNSTDASDIKRFISCQIFYVNNFLKNVGGLDKNMLPLLATILGNDYLKRQVFNNFYGLIKIDKNKKLTLAQRRVKGLVNWLKKETFDSGLKQVVASLPKNSRQRVKDNINSIVSGYSSISSTCLENYLPKIICKKHLKDIEHDLCVQLKELNITDDTTSECSNDSETEIAENLHITGEDEIKDVINDQDDGECTPSVSVHQDLSLPFWLLDRSRKCHLRPQIITLFTLKTYYFIPQVEDCSQKFAGEIALPILQIIASIVLNKETTITYWYRYGYNSYQSKRLQCVKMLNNTELPNLYSLDKLSCDEHKILLLKTLNINNDMCFLDKFPQEWHLIILCLIYWLKNCKTLLPYHIHAIILMLIAVNIFETKVGIFRKLKLFTKKYGSKVNDLQKGRENIQAKYCEDRTTRSVVIDDLSLVTTDDCLLLGDVFITNFNINQCLKDRPRRNFLKSLIHDYAEFQTILELVQMLNLLLLQPYCTMKISKFYCGTFLYNVTVIFKQQTDIIGYLEKIYIKTPNILNLHMSIFYHLSQFTNFNLPINLNRQISRRRRKKQRKIIGDHQNSDVDDDDLIDESEQYIDKNNKFSLLQQKSNL